MSMHADEESDEGVVPMKRSNNEGVASAETVEGRTSPEGNGGQTAAARTLRRDTASNGLAAVRRAARHSKTVRSRPCCITSPPISSSEAISRLRGRLRPEPMA